MDRQKFIGVVEADLAPLLGATVGETLDSSRADQLCSFHGPARIALKPSREASFKVLIERSQLFEPAEKKLIDDYMDEIEKIADISSPNLEDLLEVMPRRVIARHLGGGHLLDRLLSHLDAWSSQTYEGKRIAVAFGLEFGREGESGVEADVFAQFELLIDVVKILSDLVP